MPLRVFVCDDCLLVQSEHYEAPGNIFSDYAYFSGYSSTWREHCARYAEEVAARYGLTSDHRVVEIASNDGVLLQCFAHRGIPVLGVEPAANVAKVAIKKGIPTIVEFFGRRLGAELHGSTPADLLIGNNVLAHVPDINDFVAGMKLALNPHGVITMEFPHVLNTLELNQFDTIYHEHFAYLSLRSVRRIFATHGLRVFDVQEIPTHGGSLRIHACHDDDGGRPEGSAVSRVLDVEARHGLDDPARYTMFGEQAFEEKRRILELLIRLKSEGATIAGYGAPAKGNTLLNFCGIRTDFLDFTTDINPAKQGAYLPGVRIPIREPDAIRAARPDYVFILPWNLREEVMEQIAYVREWGGRFIARAPSIQIFE